MRPVFAAPEPCGEIALWRERRDGVEVCFTGGHGTRESRWSAAGFTPPTPVAHLEQVHSDAVATARPGFCGAADALVTTTVGLVLEVRTADCVPVLVALDGAVAAIHAGWRGIAAGIVPKALDRLRAITAQSSAHTDDRAKVAAAWVGPAIGPCCYEVGEDVARAVTAASAIGVARPGPRGRPHLDLAEAVGVQLATWGIPDVRTIAICTRCHPVWLASFRRDGATAGRNFAWIVRRSDALPG